jgi:short-subunit dehydrogenase
MQITTESIIWITGASSGIGEALALSCAKKGAKLILSARNTERLENVKHKCFLHCSFVSIIPFDHEDNETLLNAVSVACSLFGRIDFVFLNAGISQRSMTRDTALHVYRRLMEINYFGTITLTLGILPLMLRQKSGHITVISSIAGKFGTQMRSGYCASKHALAGFFESLAVEVYTSNVKVTVVYPGYINTPITLHSLTADGSPYAKMDDSLLHGISADKCAEKIIQGVENDKGEIIIAGLKERTAVWLNRFAPGLLRYILRRMDPIK